MPLRRVHTYLFQIITEKGDPGRDSIPREGPYVSLVPSTSPLNTLGTNMIGVHNSNGATTSPTLISPQRCEWLYAAHARLNHGTNFLHDLLSLMLRHHPRAETINPQGRRYKPSNQWATLPTLQRVIQLTFQSRAEIFASPLNCSMEPGITYCTAYPEGSSFGALHNAFSYRTSTSDYVYGNLKPQFSILNTSNNCL